MNKASYVGSAVLAAATGLAAPASAQMPALMNTSFETAGPGVEALGWHNFRNTVSRRRTLGDGLFPAAVARTGDASAQLGTRGDGGFVGMTTDTFDFSTFLFYNPSMNWAEGDIVARGWYYIPTTDPIVGDRAGVKLEVRLINSQIAFSREDLSIDGHTDNEWRQYEIRITRADMDLLWQAFVDFCTPIGCYDAANGFPMQVSILPLRFASDGTPTSGTIFWDDMEFFQEPLVTCPCAADYDQSGGTPDGGDIQAFFADWIDGNAAADVDCSGGTPDGGDIDLFFSQWIAGGC